MDPGFPRGVPTPKGEGRTKLLFGKSDTDDLLFLLLFLFLQNAIKQKGIEIRDVEKPILGTEEEKKSTGSQ